MTNQPELKPICMGCGAVVRHSCQCIDNRHRLFAGYMAECGIKLSQFVEDSYMDANDEERWSDWKAAYDSGIKQARTPPSSAGELPLSLRKSINALRLELPASIVDHHKGIIQAAWDSRSHDTTKTEAGVVSALSDVLQCAYRGIESLDLLKPHFGELGYSVGEILAKAAISAMPQAILGGFTESEIVEIAMNSTAYNELYSYGENRPPNMKNVVSCIVEALLAAQQKGGE